MSDPTNKENTTSASFKQANPSGFSRAKGNIEVVQQLATIERRTAQTKDRMRAHCKRFEESWTAKEAFTIWNKRKKLCAKLPSPANQSGGELSNKSIMKKARQTVQAHMTRRLSNINRIAAKMENAALKNTKLVIRQQAPRLSREFDKKRNQGRKL